MTDTSPTSLPEHTPAPGATAQSAPLAERGVVVAGLRLATAMNDVPRERMTRAPLVLLPAAGFRWRDYAPALAAFTNERRVFTLDWPGFGGSAKPAPDAFTYGELRYTEILAGWLDALGIARAVLLGNGIGADVALRYAAAHPARVLGLGLVAPLGFGRTAAFQRLIARALGSPPLLRWLEPMATALLLGPTTEATRSIADQHAALRTGPDAVASRAALAALWRQLGDDQHLASLAQTVRAPALVVRGALDPLVSAEDSRAATAAIGEHGTLEVVLPESGHLPFLQQPERFHQAVAGLLATVEAGSAT